SAPYRKCWPERKSWTPHSYDGPEGRIDTLRRPAAPGQKMPGIFDVAGSSCPRIKPDPELGRARLLHALDADVDHLAPLRSRRAGPITCRRLIRISVGIGFPSSPTSSCNPLQSPTPPPPPRPLP